MGGTARESSEINYFSERPRPNFTLDPFHRALLTISLILAVGLPVYFWITVASHGGTVPVH